jgi:tetratricopeptide (TPR) repeat protein
MSLSILSWRRTLLAGLLAVPGGMLVSADRAVAQSVAERASLEAFRDSVAETQDSVGLLRLEQRLIEATKADRFDPMSHLRLGFLALRIGELAGTSHYDDAASEFQWAIDLRPAWPYPWYGMGLAELALGDSKITLIAGLQTMFGKDALTRAAGAFARSAEVDPTFVKGLVELANTALRQRVNLRTMVALEALRRSASTEAMHNPEVLLARGRIEREVGDLDSALAALTSLVARDSGPLSRAELARTRLLRGEAAATEALVDAVASNDSAVVSIVRRDIYPIGSDSIMAEYDALAGKYRADWLRRFWSDRDDIALRKPGERVTEHYRRWFYARRSYALLSTLRRRFDIAERYRSGSLDFDDRGIIYVRHGPPTSRALYTGTAERLDPNESWLYERADGDLVFHFVAREDVQDFRLVESVFDILGYSRAVAVQTGGLAQDTLTRGGGGIVGADTLAEQLLISRQGLAPIYQKLLNTGGTGTSFQRIASEERSEGARAIQFGTTSDSWEPRLPKPVDARCQVVGVGQRNAYPLLQIACAARAGSLAPVTVPQGVVYQMRLRFTATDSSGRVVASVDTSRRFLSPALVPEQEFLVAHLAIPATAFGKLTYRFLLQESDSAGLVSPTKVVVVPPASTARLTLSDLVLGSRNSRAIWRTSAADTVFFNPLGTFRRNETLELFYEVLGADPFQPHTTTLVIRKGGGESANFLRGVSGGGSGQVTLRFEDQSPRGDWRVQRSVNLEKLKPGEYTMEITVTAANGMKDTRRRAFRVVA